MAETERAHGLGPHVVGQRVVVRRVVAGEVGPSRGPAMTDLLGVCLSWDGETCVIEPESGPPVAIPVREIVAGKPVPPRASVRQRIGVREAEIRALPQWVDPVGRPLGEWVLRTVAEAPGLRLRRTNSCLAVGDPGRPFADAEAAVRDFYGGLRREALAQVEVGSEHESAFLASGWTDPDDAVEAPFQVASVAMALRATGDSGSVETSVDGTRVLAVLRVEGAEAGRVRGELNDDWVGVHGLYVDERHRRRGLGRALMAGLLEAAAELGATTAWLEVATDNEPALALYDALGFRTHHTCRYLAAPSPAAAGHR